MLRVILLFAIVLGSASLVVAEEKPSADAEQPVGADAPAADVRAAVERALPYLEKVGTAWMRGRKCNSCHVVTFLVWSHNAAAAHGLDVDRAKLAEWTRWSLADSLEENYWFGVRPGT